MPDVLELRKLVKEFPGQRAVDGLTLSVSRGEFFSLLGPSGCGKTTTLRLIAGFEQPTSGEIRINGETVNERKPYERNVSTVFQNYALFPHLTAQQNVEFGLKQKRVPDSPRRAAEALAMVRLTGKETRRPAQLSGGERQRVALARSLVLRPDVLLLDEPLSALDPQLRKQMRAELKDVQRQVETTFLFITHDQEEALSLSDRVAVLNQGRLEQIGTPEDIYLRPQTQFVAGFLGAVNWINGVGVRPESVRLTRNPPPGTSLPVEIVRLVFLGNCFHVHTRLPNGEQAIAEIARGGETFSPGESAHLHWLPADELRPRP